MALKTQRGSEFPEGAIKLSEKEALQHQWKFIKNWPSEAEVASIKFGRHIVSAITSASSFYIINYFKSFLNISFGRSLFVVTPGIVLPAYVTYQSTDSVITESTLLMKFNCPICDQLKFACIQFYMGLIFPTLYGYLSFSNMANLTQSYPMPSFKTQPKEYWKTTFYILKKTTPHFQAVGLVQTLLILFLPYIQSKQFSNFLSQVEKNNFSNIDSDELKSGF